MERKHLIIGLLILLLLIGACARPPTLNKSNKTKKMNFTANATINTTIDINTTATTATSEHNDSDIIAQIENQTAETEETTAPPEANETAVKPDRIDVHQYKSGGSNKSDVIALFGGKTTKFTLDEGDKDAVIFEISKKFGKPLKLIRSLIYFEGFPYLKPSQLKATTEIVATAADEKLNPETIPFLVEKEEGFIRGVGCILEKNLLRVKVANEGDEDIKLFRDVRPRIKGALVISLSTRVLAGLYCDGKDVIPAGKIVDCVKTNVMFIRTRQKVEINENATDASNVKDLLVAYQPGYYEKVAFDCYPGIQPIKPGAATANITNATFVQVNTTTNQTVNRTNTINSTE